MATIFLGTADLRDLTLWSATGNVTITDEVPARTGTYVYKQALTSATYATINVPAAATYYVRFALYEQKRFILAFRSGSTDLARINMSTWTTLLFQRGTTTLGTYVLPGLPLWSVFEVYAKIHGTTGEISVKINGQTFATLTNVNTGASDIDNIQLRTIPGADIMHYDDFAVDDSAWPGLGGIEVLLPSAAGTYTNWDSGAYTAVDDNPPNDDTDYIATDAAVSNIKFSANIENLATGTQSVKGIMLAAKAKLDGAGSGTLKPFIRSGTTDDTPTGSALTTAYSWYTRCWDTDPGNSNNAWSESAVNALEIGVAS